MANTWSRKLTERVGDTDDDIVKADWLWFNELMSVFHLKYRPHVLSELDLPEVAEKLKSFIGAEIMPQSFLFSGPKGAGKTSAARIFAKTINCLSRKKGESCEDCDNCSEINENRSMDIIEMDAASNRGIEDVRDLKDKAYLLPTKLKYKVFIIDEVHMLTKDAFNALLKLIEEPPKHTIFILCTTGADKIPETVLSRLIRVDFRKGGQKELRNSLNKIIKGEEIEIEETAINFILERSDGSFRNLQKGFNELFLWAGKKLSLKAVEDFFVSKSGNYSPVEFEKDLADGDIAKILKRLEKISEEGINLINFREDLLMYFQKKLLIAFKVLEGEDGLMSSKRLEEWINLLIRAARQEKETELDQLPLELAVIDFLNKSDIPVKGSRDEEKMSESKEKIKTAENKIIKENDEVVTVDILGVSLGKVEEYWGNVLIAVKPSNHSVEAFLRAARPIKLEGRNLTLEVFYPFHKERLEETRNRKIVEEGLLKVFGVGLAFECVLGKNRKEPLVIRNDTPMERVSEHLIKEKKGDSQDLYDVAKDIFG